MPDASSIACRRVIRIDFFERRSVPTAVETVIAAGRATGTDAISSTKLKGNISATGYLKTKTAQRVIKMTSKKSIATIYFTILNISFSRCISGLQIL
jgi:hypothetical protein